MANEISRDNTSVNSIKTISKRDSVLAYLHSEIFVVRFVFHPQCGIFQFSHHSDFSWNQFWLIFEGQNSPFYHFRRLWILIFWEFHTSKCEKFPKIQNSELLKWSKWQVLTPWNWSKLISRKIRVAGKLLNFHTVISEFCKENNFWQRLIFSRLKED